MLPTPSVEIWSLTGEVIWFYRNHICNIAPQYVLQYARNCESLWEGIKVKNLDLNSNTCKFRPLQMRLLK